MKTKQNMITAENALSGRNEPLFILPELNIITQKSMFEYPDHAEIAMFGMGCFWGVERLFWQQEGVISTSCGYSGGFTQNPTYKEVCTGQTGHAEVVRIFFDPNIIAYNNLLKLFWQNHNPTQGMRQGADVGTQYRSVIFTYNQQQQDEAVSTKQLYQAVLNDRGVEGSITTEIHSVTDYFFAEEYHQQYLEKNPDGYCGLGGIEGCAI